MGGTTQAVACAVITNRKLLYIAWGVCKIAAPVASRLGAEASVAALLSSAIGWTVIRQESTAKH